MRIFLAAGLGAILGAVAAVTITFLALALWDFVATNPYAGLIAFTGALPGAIVLGVFESMDDENG